jgi:hypothetical protein
MRPVKVTRQRICNATIVVVLVGLGVAIPTSAEGVGTDQSNVPLDTAPIPHEQQRQYAAEVTDFAAHNIEPQPLFGVSKEEFSGHADVRAAYHQKVPWEAVFGQWGCHVEVLNNGIQFTDGAKRAVMSWATECGSLPHGGKVIPRTEEEFQTGLVTAQARYCGTIQSGEHCLETPYTGRLNASYKWLGFGTAVGFVRAGRPGLGNPCGLGITLADSQTKVLNYDQFVLVGTDINQNSQYSSAFYQVGLGWRSTFCAIL